MLPFISVIIPVRNERAMLPRLLEQLLAQNYPSDRYEILVVDGRSTDGTPNLVARRFSRRRVPIRVLDNPGIRSSAGRNVGVRAAAGDVFLFIDGHCNLPSRNLLEDTAAILQRTGAACLCRPQPLLAPSPTHTGEVIAQARASWLGRDSDTSDTRHAGFVDPAGSGSAYRREVFEHLGLYDESFDTCEDIEFNTRLRKAGFTAHADPRLTVHYQPRPHLRALFRQMMRRGRGRIRLMRRHAGCVSPIRLAPLGLVLSTLLALLGWFILPAAVAAILTLPFAFFAGAVAVAAFQLGARHGVGYAWKAPWVFAAMYYGLGTGQLMELLRPRTASQPAERLAPRPQVEVAPVRRAA